MVSGFRGTCAPTERSVSSHQHRRDRIAIELRERATNGRASFEFVVTGNLGRIQAIGDRHWPMKIVCVRCPEAWDRGFRLGPRCGVLRMRVRYSTDAGEMFVQFQMRRQVRGGAQVAVDDFACEVGDDHVRWRQLLIGNAARLDGNQPFGAIDPADIAEGVEHKTAANQFQVRFQDLFAQCLQQHWGKMKDPQKFKRALFLNVMPRNTKRARLPLSKDAGGVVLITGRRREKPRGRA